MTSSIARAGTFVVGVSRFADPFNTWARGVQAICSGSHDRSAYIPPPVIGQTSAISTTSSCGTLGRALGIYGRAGDVIDGLGRHVHLI